MSETAAPTPPAKPARPVVAFQVNDDEICEIVFHRHGLAARREGANKLGTDFESVECLRLPWADAFAAQGWVPASECVAHGWWFDGCLGCGARIDEDTQIERGLTAERVHGSQGGAVYCCVECAADEAYSREKRAEFGAEVLERLRERVRARFGEVEFVTGHGNEHVYVTDDKGPLVAQQAFVSFGFPGQHIAPARLRWDALHLDTRNTAWIGGRRRPQFGPPAPEYSVCAGDKGAFEAFVEATRSSARPLPLAGRD